MPDNLRTTTKARIKRASASARRNANSLDRRYQRGVDELYRIAASDLQQRILDYADSNGGLRLEVMQDLLSQVNQRLDVLARERNQLLTTGQIANARLAVEPFAEVVHTLARVPDEAVRFAQSFVDADGLQLSDRLWRIDQGARESLGRSIGSAIVQGHSASQAAEDFILRGSPTPADLRHKIANAQAGSVAKTAAKTLLTGAGNPRANALRVFRTEINRAHGEAYRMAAFDAPDVIGTRYLLSPNHPRPDICNMHAAVNRYGLGPGVYPKGKSPWPAHPNTLSYEEVVFGDEVTSEDRAGKEDRISWLIAQPPAVQMGTVGGRKKRAALIGGILKENEIATPWRALKKRYERRGINTDELRISDIEGTVPVSSLPAIKKQGTAKPVSVALEIVGQKKISKHTLGIIDTLHNDGTLPIIPIQSASSNAKYYGAYRYYPGSGKSHSIRVKAGGDHKAFTLAHEVGHFIDHQGLPGSGFASISHPVMAQWRGAVDSSRAIGHLQTLKNGANTVTLKNGMRYPINKGHIDYLLDYEEIWARSYSQWVADRSGDPLLKKQLQTLIDSDKSATISYTSQWADDDFAPIAKRIDEIMGHMGWLKK